MARSKLWWGVPLIMGMSGFMGMSGCDQGPLPSVGDSSLGVEQATASEGTARLLVYPVVPTRTGKSIVVDGETLFLAPDPLVTEDDLTHARRARNNNRYTVYLDFNEAGAQRLQDWSSAHVGEQLAIMWCEDVLFAPYVNSPFRSLAVPFLSESEADQLVSAGTGFGR